jgi:hypothetical protein
MVLHRWAATAPLPEWRSLDSLVAWGRDEGPLVVAIALGRVGALAAAWYLVVAGTVGAAAAVTRTRPLVKVAQWLLPVSARSIVAGVAGTGVALTVAPVGPAVAAPAATARAAVPAPVAHDPGAAVGSAAGTAVLTELGPGEIAPDGLPAAASDPTVSPATGSEAAPPGDIDEWTVAAGESFWSIAADHVAEQIGHAPTDAEIASYWTLLIDANRDRLADPGNIDLLFPGQQLALPPMGAGR